MKITYETIKNLNPSEELSTNFKQYCGDSAVDADAFIHLDKVSYEDRVWVMTRLLDKNQLVRWAIYCAESVEIMFEDRNPGNTILSSLFDCLDSVKDFTALSYEERSAISLHRRSADGYAAYASAYAGAYASYAADAAAALAAAYAAATAYAVDAAYTSAYDYAEATALAADAAVDQEWREYRRNINLLFLRSLIEA